MNKILLLLIMCSPILLAEEYVTVESVDSSPYVCSVGGLMQDGLNVDTHKATERVVNLTLSNPEAEVLCWREEVLRGELTAAGRALVTQAPEDPEHPDDPGHPPDDHPPPDEDPDDPGHPPEEPDPHHPPVEPPDDPHEPPVDPHDPPAEPPVEPEPPVVEPPTAQCGSPYRGIPDPCAHFGFDVFADYEPDEVITGVKSGEFTINRNGTAADPYVIDATQATFNVGGQAVKITGEYLIFTCNEVNATGESPFQGNATFSVYRNCDIAGNNSFWSHGAAIESAGNTLFQGFKVHNFGVLDTNSQENDQHGWKVMKSDVWILDSEGYELSGDGVQCGDASRGRCDRVYIAGNHFHHNRENGVDIKDSRDVVVSTNTMDGFSPTGSSGGVALVIHDDAFDARIYGNTISDSNIGIVSSGASGHVIEGNTITALLEGIQLRNTANLTVRDNTIVAPTCVKRQSGVSGDIQSGCEGIQ